jgi:hypothetical protein
MNRMNARSFAEAAHMITTVAASHGPPDEKWSPAAVLSGNPSPTIFARLPAEP